MDFTTGYYATFEVEDFLTDPFFQDWVIHPDKENTFFWEQFVAEYPFKKDSIAKAKELLESISFKEHFPEDHEIEAALHWQLQAIRQEEAPVGIAATRSFFSVNAWKLAAICTGAIAFITVLVFYMNKPERVYFKTAYGEIRKIVLPDSSVIILNGNSSIAYNSKWQSTKAREIWLEGEAYFNVRHLNKDTLAVQPGERFTVHTSDMNVEVMGTTFNVRQRRGKTEVVLETGSVRISFINAKQQPVILKPGEMISYRQQQNQLAKDTTIATEYTAWKQRKLVLHDPTVDEIVQYLEDNFGRKIVLENESMRHRKIEGPILFDNLDDALFILSTVLNTKIIKQDSTIILRPR